jgi:hypothetical protein
MSCLMIGLGNLVIAQHYKWARRGEKRFRDFLFALHRDRDGIKSRLSPVGGAFCDVRFLRQCSEAPLDFSCVSVMRVDCGAAWRIRVCDDRDCCASASAEAAEK